MTHALLFFRRASALYMALLFALLASRCVAATLYVSQDGNDNNSGTATSPYKTIQAAVNNANSRDTITLHAGTFSGNSNRDIDFAGKSLTINSDSGAARTVIDCGGAEQGPHRAFYLHSKENNVLFEGLTIKNGTSDGAIYISRSCTIKINKCGFSNNITRCVTNSGTVILASCIFLGNLQQGCVVNGGTATLTDCTFTSNKGDDSSMQNSGTATLTRCTFTGNNGKDNGGGVDNSGTATLTDCVISGNNGGEGGGVYNIGTATLTDCIITGNISKSNGGGISNSISGTATLTNCVISGNTGRGNGGGGVFISGTATLTNCVISGNTTTAGNGGGICNYGNTAIRCCSICGNVAKTATNQQVPAQGGGLENNDTAILTNDILWGNDAPNAAEIGTPADSSQTQTTTVTYCDIQGGLSGTGNIKVNPLFIRAATAIMPPLGVTNVDNADLHLQASSPCRGAGITIGPGKPDPNQAGNRNYKPDPGVSTDADGKRRPNPPSIGAYENSATAPPAKRQPMLDLGTPQTDNTPNASPALGTTPAPTTQTTKAPNPPVDAAQVVAPPTAPQSRPKLWPDEQKKVNAEFLQLLVTLNTNHVTIADMTQQIQVELDKGADINTKDSEGFPAIVTAASLSHLDVVQVLLEHGADVNAVTEQAVKSNVTDSTSILHKTANGYQVNIGGLFAKKSKPLFGQTALMYAAQLGQLDLVGLLLKHNANAHLQDSHGKYAVDYAKQAHQDGAIQLL